ncbi:MAG: hypothetical protein F4X72_09630 [Dehalococcoidia bacterium]|nr:hypothetical protein [Dehalococcoidia bacterium]
MGTQLIRWDGMISMVTGGLLVVWWILVATLFPTLDPTVGMVDIVGESTWLPFSLPGAVAAILLPGVIVSLYMAQKGMVSKAGQVGFYLSLVGSVMFAWVQIEQTFVWPRIVEEAPNLVDYSFPILGNNQFDFIYWPAHLLLAVGLFLFGQATVKAGVFPRWTGHLLWFGGLTFGISGIVLGLRFLSIITFGPALIWMGFLQWRDRGAAY